MALRNQPYLPLYVQDYLTDEKLSMCTWTTQGVYIKLLCLLHKSDPYGTILIKQKDKQTENKCLNFALKVAKTLPIEIGILEEAIRELVDEKCLTIDNDKLFQKRMVRDNNISEKRAEAGQKGGKKTQRFAKAKSEANTENEDAIVIDYDFIIGNYHTLCSKLSKVSVLSEKRKGHINARFAEFGMEKITEVLRKAGESDFLCGQNDRAWKADFDWLMNPNNFIKVLEGKYEGKQKQSETILSFKAPPSR